MKIVVLDGYTENPGDLSWEGLEKLGDLTVYDRTPKELVAERMQGAEAVFTNKTVIREEDMAKCQTLRFIGVLATGYNIVDLDGARKHQITVSNVPAYSTRTVAQFTMALLLEMCDHVGEHSRAVKEGEWSNCIDFCFWKYPLIELAGKTMGIIGYGRIGQEVAKIARAFGMEVIVSSHHKIAEELLADSIRSAGLEEVFGQADIITLHCPLTEETKELICKDSIARMKDGVKIINTGRGPLINEQDLADALKSGKVSGAAVDVASVEPIPAESPLLTAPNMIITPHIAWAAKEARERLMDITVQNLEAYINGNPIHVVS